jgi:uncharacterized protein YegL
MNLIKKLRKLHVVALSLVTLMVTVSAPLTSAPSFALPPLCVGAYTTFVV